MLARVPIALLLAASALFTPSYGQSVDWTLTDAQLARLHHGAVLVDAAVVEGRPPGEIRAAVQVHAPAERVFRTLTNCAEAPLRSYEGPSVTDTFEAGLMRTSAPRL